jgi:hypothetical protein
MRTRTRHAAPCLVALLVAAVGSSLLAAPADAQTNAARPAPTAPRAPAAAGAVAISIQVIHATAAAGTSSPELADQQARLRRQFAQFQTFRQIDRKRLTIRVGESADVVLPSEQKVTITLLGIENGAFKLRMSVPGGNAEATSPNNGVFYFGGPPHQGGSLILAIRTTSPS